jgi:hypothetical protein
VHGVFPYFYIPYDGSAPPDKMGYQIVMALVVFQFMNTMQKNINYSNSIFIIPTQENIHMTFC